MPDRLRRTGVRSDWADANRGGQPTDSFLEGPVFDAAGNLYVSDIPFGRIFRIDARGEWEQVAEWAGEPNGMKFLNDKELLVTDYRNGLMVCDIAAGAVRPYLERRNSERFKGVNDLIFDSRGNLYFTDQGQTGLHDPTGRLYRLRPSGQLDLLLGNVPSPNGVALSPDERVLYLGVTRGNQVWRVPLLDDGSVAKVERVLHVLRPQRSRWPGGGPARPGDRRQSRTRRGLGAQPQGRARGGAAQLCRRVTDQRRLWRARSQDAVLHRVDQRLGAASHARRARRSGPSRALKTIDIQETSNESFRSVRQSPRERRC